jgi:DNA-binding transcriptional ArsR family regulator
MSTALPPTDDVPIALSSASLLGTRVRVSPLVALVVVLVDAFGDAGAGAWGGRVRGRLEGLDHRPLAMFMRDGGGVPDSLLPLPMTRRRTLEDELAVLRATPPELLAKELSIVPDPLGRGLGAFVADPARAMQGYCDALEAHWRRLLAPEWSSVRRVLEREELLVGHRLATAGLAATLSGMHPALDYRGGALRVHRRFEVRRERAPSRASLVLIPIPAAPDRLVINEEHPGATLIAYPARGLQELWAPRRPTGRELAELLGESRACVLLSLELPSTTHDLAARLHMAPSTVSRHLTALAGLGLAERARCGLFVAYRLSDRGSSLLELFAA